MLSVCYTLWIFHLSLLEGLDARELLFITFSVSEYGVSDILIHLLCHSVTLGPMCLIFCIYTLDRNVFPRSQNKHFGLIFYNPSSSVYYISFSEMLACLCFFPTLGSSIPLIDTQFIFKKALCFFPSSSYNFLYSYIFSGLFISICTFSG